MDNVISFSEATMTVDEWMKKHPEYKEKMKEEDEHWDDFNWQYSKSTTFQNLSDEEKKACKKEFENYNEEIKEVTRNLINCREQEIKNTFGYQEEGFNVL